MLIMNGGKRQMTEGIELPNQGKNQNTQRKRYLGILEVDTIKQAKMKSIEGRRHLTVLFWEREMWIGHFREKCLPFDFGSQKEWISYGL